MSQPEAEPTNEHPAHPTLDVGLPPGDHPVEVAARRGIGPMSPLARDVWHGNATPCVSCGQLVARSAVECDHCGQDLGEEMLSKMRVHAGPWFVLEHVRPFPGVTMERIVRQIRRGLLTETSILKGPATHFQWRFAVETPGICRYFSKCWRCQQEVTPSETSCKHCGANLLFVKPSTSSAGASVVSNTREAASNSAPVVPAASTSVTSSSAPPATSTRHHLHELTAALDEAKLPRHRDPSEGPPRIAGISATWIAAGLIALVILALMWITQART